MFFAFDYGPVLSVAAGYVLGSIPFGYLIVRMWAGADVRETGSGGTGATNVTRRAGKAAGLLTLALDALKGWAAVAFARWLTGGEGEIYWPAVAGVAAIVGHVFPLWLGFRGGKGVATGLGAFLALSPLAVACSAALFLLLVGLTRYVSLGSILGAASFPLWLWLLGAGGTRSGAETTNYGGWWSLIVAALTGSALIIAKHHGNIARLLAGTENKFR
ncbi:MAG TPA: glycerol-3-phosphate 1-O-acyltransferase PlsY [Pyrinomonadaceae bacterium]|nr:glycerol-3-phosphate 1-O-acyltransferase PlsY [Pyrinomonadaceae bacterium]